MATSIGDKGQLLVPPHLLYGPFDSRRVSVIDVLPLTFQTNKVDCPVYDGTTGLIRYFHMEKIMKTAEKIPAVLIAIPINRK
jgi:hypothetical protein